jgi:transcriptional regulator with XRE-family HTH domain
VDTPNDVSAFLTSRRARIAPEQVGLPFHVGRRRVPGLRREEVASLAGVSVEYYKRLERGNLRGVSDTVLEALARALQLDDAERTHLFDLARAAGPLTRRRGSSQQRVRPSVRRILDAMTLPAYVRNARRDILAANPLGKALYSELFRDPVRPVNPARFIFLDPRAHEFFLDWDELADDAVAGLRIDAGRTPYDRGLSDLVGELSTRSEEFRARWVTHNVRFHRSGAKHLDHPIVGELDLTFEALELPADAGLTIVTYSAEPGSRSEQSLKLLASWAATVEHAETARDARGATQAVATNDHADARPRASAPGQEQAWNTASSDAPASP